MKTIHSYSLLLGTNLSTIRYVIVPLSYLIIFCIHKAYAGNHLTRLPVIRALVLPE